MHHAFCYHVLLIFKDMRRLYLLIFVFSAFACETSLEVVERSTWDIIQEDILQPKCAACHTAGTTFANQSDLVLTKDVAYSQLVNRAPNNLAAKADGLELVGTDGLESLFNSYLWEKINFPDFEHYYQDHQEYGELMPLGGPSLTYGELEYIRRWIIAGAPMDGVVAEENLLEDEDRFEIPTTEFARLTPPASGVQLNLGPFEVPAQFEREFWYYMPLGNAEDLYVTKFESTMRSGSHHLLLYDYPQGDHPESEVYRDIRTEDNFFIYPTVQSIANQRYVIGTQLRNSEYELPEGVALRLPPNYSLDINSHYVNYTDDVMQGEISVNLHSVDPSEVDHIAKNIFLNNTSFYLPPQQESTISKTWNFNQTRNIFMLSSHAHQYNTEFRIYISGGSRDGELVYFSRDWEHPPLMEYDPPLVLNPGEGLRAEATYNNTTDDGLEFGLLSVNEMMIIFGMYY